MIEDFLSNFELPTSQEKTPTCGEAAHGLGGLHAGGGGGALHPRRGGLVRAGRAALAGAGVAGDARHWHCNQMPPLLW